LIILGTGVPGPLKYGQYSLLCGDLFPLIKEVLPEECWKEELETALLPPGEAVSAWGGVSTYLENGKKAHFIREQVNVERLI